MICFTIITNRQSYMEVNCSQKRSRQLKERSNSAKHIKSGRQTRNYDYYGSSIKPDHPQLLSKHSKQYPKAEYNFSDQKTQSKNLNDNADYIKSLYKKYLGKQNNKSQRKQRADPGVVKNLFGKETRNNELSSKPLQESLTIINSRTQQSQKKPHFQDDPQPQVYCNARYTLSKKKSTVSAELPVFKKKQSQEAKPSNFYTSMMNEEYLDLMGNSRSSLILCMRDICRAKRLAGAKCQ